MEMVMFKPVVSCFFRILCHVGSVKRHLTMEVNHNREDVYWGGLVLPFRPVMTRGPMGTRLNESPENGGDQRDVSFIRVLSIRALSLC